MKISFLTLGCKVNFYETEKMMEQFSNAGFQVVDTDQACDVFLINTCTVTNMADKKSRQMIHRGKRKNPNCVVVAVGCYADSAGDLLRKDDKIDLVLSNSQKDNVLLLVTEKLKEMGMFHGSVEENSSHIPHERTRAFIKVQDGCNQFCSYCIIPYVRGKLKSRTIRDVVSEVEELARKGYREVVITGIHLSSFGVDQSNEKSFVNLEGKPLLQLLREVNEIKGIQRIRLGSLEPRIITENFLEQLVKIEKVCPHFHLSLQSGCDATLKRMNRHYTCADYKNKCELLREFYVHPAITTDVIVGFPGETEEEFLETMEFLEQIKLSDIHIFKYSVRSGTKAETMENPVSEQAKNQRSNQLQEKTEQWKSEFSQLFIGQEQKVLFEELVTIEEKEYFVGHTTRYVKVAVSVEKATEIGAVLEEIKDVKVEMVLKK